MFLSAALLSEDEAAHFVAEPMNLLWIGSGTEALCQGKEGFFLFLLRFEPALDEFDEDPVVAKTFFPGDSFDLLSEPDGESNAAADLFGSSHSTIVHHSGAFLGRSFNPEARRRERVYSRTSYRV